MSADFLIRAGYPENMKAGLLISLAFSIFNAGRAQPLSFEVASVKPALADQGVRVVAMGSIPNMPPTNCTCRRSALLRCQHRPR